MPKMAVMKAFTNLLIQNQKSHYLETGHGSLDSSSTKFIEMMTLDLLHGKVKYGLTLLNEENVFVSYIKH